MTKQYYSISEVSKLLNIKEHVIRHWDSIDPKTNKYRIENLSTRTKGGTRFFSKSQIKKLEKIFNLLRDNGSKNNSLNLVSKLISQNNKKNHEYYTNEKHNSDSDSLKKIQIIAKVEKINKKLKNLINYK